MIDARTHIQYVPNASNQVLRVIPMTQTLNLSFSSSRGTLLMFNVTNKNTAKSATLTAPEYTGWLFQNSVRCVVQVTATSVGATSVNVIVDDVRPFCFTVYENKFNAYILKWQLTTCV